MPRRTVSLALTPDECAWLTLELPADYRWPPAPQVRFGDDVAGGPDDVRPFLPSGVAALTGHPADPTTYRMSDVQLWWLHDFVRPEARAGKCPSGAPVMALYLKVCAALIDIKVIPIVGIGRDGWPVKEAEDATDAESHADQHAHADASTG